MEAERMSCPDCECDVLAEKVYNDEENCYDWVCLECGCVLQSEEE